MAYDQTCKYIAEHFTADLATWLMGEPIQFSKLEPSELIVEPIRADALILLESTNLILQAEFQTEPKADIPFRLLDYRVRGYRRYPDKDMKQVVIYLHKSQSPLVYQTQFTLRTTQHQFEVVRLWEQPSDIFLSSPGLLPFAALSQTAAPEQVLLEVSRCVEQIDDPQSKADIAAAAAILGGLVLDRGVIQRILRQDIMRESVIYQEILAEGEAKGRQEALVEVAMNLLRQGMAPEQVASATGLDLVVVQTVCDSLG